MTLDDLKNRPGEVITPAVAAEFLQCDPQWIRLAARKSPEKLGFPVICVKSRVKIPKAAFIAYMEGRTA